MAALSIACTAELDAAHRPGGQGGNAGSSGETGGAASETGGATSHTGGRTSPSEGGRSPTTGGAVNDPGGSAGEGPLTGACTDPPAALRPETRLVRLTHRQYDNTVRDLTGLDLGLAADFLADPRQAGYDRGIDRVVGEVLGKAYRSAAETIAAKVVTTTAAFDKVVLCAPEQGESCAKSFIAQFGKRAFRRPLTASEQAAYFDLFVSAPALVESGDDFRKGVRLVVEAMLQSPKFLYRAELSNYVVNGNVTLDSYELASRLSYLIQNTMPDAALFEAADDDELTSASAIGAQAGRLALSTGSYATVRDFHHQWLDLDIYPNKLTKDSAAYPGVTPELAPILQQEVERFIEEVTFQDGRGFISLLTSPFTFVNAATAKLYGVSGSFGTNLTRVQLNPSQRAGLLTQVGFLSTRAFSNQSSPIHRGVFIQRRILCADLPDPPANIPALPSVDGMQIKTTRQQVDQHTSPDGCNSCHHTLINPVGFGLENYDAIGRYRIQENGEPIDATGTLAGTEQAAAFRNGVELSKAIAESPEARLCYAKNWLRYGLGRSENQGDACALASISEALQDDTHTAADVLVDLAKSPAFRFRAPEVPQ